MARKLVNSKTEYKRVRIKGFNGKIKERLKPVKKTVEKQRMPRRISDNEIIKGLPAKQKAEVLKSKFKNRTAQTLGAGAETASTAITVGAQNSRTLTNTAGIGNLQQNVEGGIKPTGNRRDDDDEEDYPGVN